MDFLTDLQQAFKQDASEENAGAMAKYMKGRFIFFGIKTPERRLILKSVTGKHEFEIELDPRRIALKLYELPQREFHYAAIDLLLKALKKKYLSTDDVFIEHLLTKHSWWDSVDVIAKYLLGGYLAQYPEKTETLITKFSDAENLWLNRSAIIFQMGYKNHTDEALLFKQCLKQKTSDEFFIKKAIGWALREYGKTNPLAVRQFVSTAALKPLSTKEALKNL